jgi:hypothetical protein
VVAVEATDVHNGSKPLLERSNRAQRDIFSSLTFNAREISAEVALPRWISWQQNERNED